MEQSDQVKNTESMGKDGIIPATNLYNLNKWIIKNKSVC